MRALFLASALLLTVSVGNAQGRVWVVDDDGGPGADFTDVPPAIAAAAEGDVLLIRNGNYSSFVISGKSLTLQAEAGQAADVRTGSGSRIENLAAGQSVRLRRIRFHPEGITTGLTSSTGTIWIEDCVFLQADCESALTIDDCDNVVIINSIVGRGSAGCTGPEADPILPPALITDNSSLHVFDSRVRGARGSCWECVYEIPACRCAQLGGRAIVQTGGLLFLSNTTLEGGVGGVAFGPVGYCTVGPGGTGLLTGGETWILDSRLIGGRGGSHYNCSHNGLTGAGFAVSAGGVLHEIPGRSLSMTAPSPVRENGTISLSFQGPPHVAVWLGESARPSGFFFPPANGSVALRLPITVGFAGVTDAEGRLTVTLPLDPFSAGIDSEIRFRQPYYLDLNTPPQAATGRPARRPTRPIMGSATMTVGLDDRF